MKSQSKNIASTHPKHRLEDHGWTLEAGLQSVWSPACQDQVPGGHAGVGVVSLGALFLPH